MQETGFQMSRRDIRRKMKHHMGLSWKKMDHAKAYVNTWKNIELRKLFALWLIDTMRHDNVLINFD